MFIPDKEIAPSIRFAFQNPSNTDAMSRTPFNVQQLEECDAVDADASYLTWIDGETHAPAVEVSYHVLI